MPDPNTLPIPVNPKLLQAFVLVAELESFAGAADRLLRSRSAVSHQIRVLEQQVGAQLFHRTTRQVTLTRHGRELLECTQRAISEINSGVARLRAAASGKLATLCIACAPSVAIRKLPGVLARFAREYPAASVEVHELPSASLLAAVRDGEVDIAIGTVIDDDALSFDVLYDDPLMALVPAGLAPVTRKSTIRLQEVLAMPLVMPHMKTALRRQLEAAAAERNISIQIRHQCIHGYTIVAMVMEGLGATVQPESILLAHPPSPKVRRMRIVEPELIRQTAVITRKGHAWNDTARAFVEILHESYARPASW